MLYQIFFQNAQIDGHSHDLSTLGRVFLPYFVAPSHWSVRSVFVLFLALIVFSFLSISFLRNLFVLDLFNRKVMLFDSLINSHGKEYAKQMEEFAQVDSLLIVTVAVKLFRFLLFFVLFRW
jgi:hypothetical protein